MPKIASTVSRTCLVAATSMAAIGVSAQTLTPQESASELYFDVSTGLKVDDNYESLEEPAGTSSLWETDLALGFDSETRYQSFSFKAGARFEFGEFAEEPNQSSKWSNPFASLDYSRSSSTSLFRGALSYRERDNGINLVEDFESSTDLTVDQGTRGDARAELELLTGIDTPVRSTTLLSYHQRRFFDTTDPDLSDQDTFRFKGELGLAINRTSELLLIAEYYDRDDLDDIKNDEVYSALGVGVSTIIDQNLSFRGVLKYEQDKTTETIGDERVTSTEHSPTMDLSFVKDRPNGDIRFSIGGELDSNGVRTTALLGRGMELPHGELDFSIGVTRTSDGNINPVGSINWVRDYRTRYLILDYSSSVRTDDDGKQILRNGFSFDFVQELTKTDGIQFNMNAYATEDLDGSINDRRRAGVSLSYFRDINEELSFVTGYRHAYNIDNNEGTVTKNVVFARVDKRFSLRP